MRPLKLILRSFGPFAGEQTVDFTRYGDNAFLLIHGPTGAGKTSILDGICYALYGDPSGEKRNEHFLRSQRAASDAVCEVEFSFQVGPRRFHIKRTPPQTIAHKGRQREIKHQVEFCLIDEQGAVLGERLGKVGEVRQKIEEVLGFTSEQFRQVVVLPQGEFRKLLLAKSDEKEQILEKLFGTLRFKQLEQLLRNRKMQLASELKELKAAVEGILSSHQADSTEKLDQRLAALQAEHENMGRQLAEQTRLQQQADQQLQQAQALASRFAELDQARAALAALVERKADMEALNTRIERAARALNLVDLDERLVRSRKELQDRTAELTGLGQEILNGERRKQEALERLQLARTAVEQVPELAAEKARLEARLTRLTELDAARSTLTAARKAEQAARNDAEQCKTRIAATEQRLTDLTVAVETLAITTAEAEKLKAEAAELARWLTARQQLDQKQRQLTGVEEQLQQAAAAVAAAERQQARLQQLADDLQQRFVAGQAALLVQELKEGKPCPVCGSPDHPAPAPASEEVPDAKELDKARKALDEAAAVARQARIQKNSLDVEQSGLAAGLQALEELLGSRASQPLSLLKEEQQVLVTRIRKTQDAAQELEAVRQERTARQAGLTGDKEALAQAEEALIRAVAQREIQRTVTADLEQQAGGHTAADVHKKIAELNNRITTAQAALKKAEEDQTAVENRLNSAIGRQAEKQAQLKRLDAELTEQQQVFADRLESEGFVTAGDWQEARLPRPEIDRQRLILRQFAEGLAAAQQRLARAEGGVQGSPRPDLAAAQTAKQQADQQVGLLQKQLGQLEAAQQGVRTALAAIGEKAEKTARLEQEFAVAGRLADLAAGQNPKRMTLQRYVLASLFEEVASAASQRLSRMSRGRYHLVRSEAPRDGKATSGLDLDVTDDYSGEKRPAFTLSGGESFLASLSLALGLSDVVMAQSGGRYLDCIFIDEGFGSLDGETLDYALNTLIELHRAGRVIGIISHLAELKERIQSRLEVVAAKEGSRIAG